MTGDSEHTIDDSLLGKYLAGETSEAESERVRQWLQQSDTSDTKDFERFQRIWEASATIRPQAGHSVDTAPVDTAPVDTDAAWERVKRQMQPTAPVRKLNPWRLYTQIAAVFLLVLGIGWIGWRMTQPTPVPQLAVVSQKTRIEKTLPDGSKVWLNQGSELSYPETFAENERLVSLTGEAFFDITPNPSKPFRIQANGTTVQVVGTSFSVKAFDKNVQVAVRTGKVVFRAKTKTVTLVKNQQAAYDSKADTIRMALRLDPNVFTYKTGKLVFENTPLRELVRKLNEIYHSDVHLANEGLNNCQINTSFDEHESLETALAITAETMNLHVRRQGTQFILEGKSCIP